MKTISNKTYCIAWFICLIVCSLVQAMPYDGKMQTATSLIDSDITVTYQYDPMGNRVGRVETNASGSVVSEKKYILDYSSKVPKILLEMTNVSGNWQVTQKNYYYGNMLVMSTDGSNQNRRYYIHDRLGSVRVVTNRNISVLNNYTYSPFGEDLTSQTTETVTNNIRFAGYNYDSELAQYYVWARLYSPYMARFNGYDPVLGDFKEPLTLHQYLYCLNDPINRFDPSGKFSFGDIGTSMLIGASINGTVDYLRGTRGQDLLLSAIKGAIGGAVTGGMGAGASALAGRSVSSLGYFMAATGEHWAAQGAMAALSTSLIDSYYYGDDIKTMSIRASVSMIGGVVGGSWGNYGTGYGAAGGVAMAESAQSFYEYFFSLWGGLPSLTSGE